MSGSAAGYDPALDSLERTLTAARKIAGTLAFGLFFLALASDWIPETARVGFMVGPAGILGIVSPAIGYRLYHLLRQRVPSDASLAARHARFLRANGLALTVTAAAGTFGVVVFALTGELSALIGLVSHMILTGALWPSEARLESFVRPTATDATDG